ncbi:MAG TPA: thiamine-phosphate kinase [Bacteroidales bacterium]|nr:thiamine-phosphate kinase [Bacteroidales bacterium]
MSNTENNSTPIGKLGKFGLIKHITSGTRHKNPSTVHGIGDDAAVVDSGGKLMLITTDLFLEGIHFNLMYTPLKHLGYKAVIRGISDIYAMNGTPEQILVALGLSSRFTVEQVDEIYEGIGSACDKYDVDLAGGDTTSSYTGLTISVTATGTVGKDMIIKRNTAGTGDIVCVTGDFGAAYMGLQLLERERKLFEKEKTIQPDLSGYEYVIGRQLKPEFPCEVLAELGENDIVPTAMIDVSDCLASDLMHICKLSGTGCRIYSEKIPIDYETAKIAEEFNIDPVTPALNGGEDYELLFTVKAGLIEKIGRIRDVKVIGYMTQPESGYTLVGQGGTEIAISAQGWTTDQELS